MIGELNLLCHNVPNDKMLYYGYFKEAKLCHQFFGQTPPASLYEDGTGGDEVSSGSAEIPEKNSKTTRTMTTTISSKVAEKSKAFPSKSGENLKHFHRNRDKNRKHSIEIGRKIENISIEIGRKI